MTTGSYLVDEIGLANENLPAACDSCEWVGNAGETKDIDSTALDAGDPSPVGRCPECDSLAYLDRHQDRCAELGRALFSMLWKVVKKAERINGMQHFGRQIPVQEWEELRNITRTAKNITTKISPDFGRNGKHANKR